MKSISYLLPLFILFLVIGEENLAQIKFNDPVRKSTMSTDQAMEYYLNELKKDPYLKEHFKWSLFFAQHPMYLIVDEDRGEPAVGERIPPWGAKTKEKYVERVRRNLKSLDDLPELKLNYQWSALELEDLCNSFPDIYEWMQRLYKKGSLDFLDGTYSQAHLQVLTSESNWRQFEYGLEIYEDLFNKKVDLYARQETGLHTQLPQLLRLFGYNYATLPAFVSTVEIIDGPFEFIVQEGRLEAVNGEGFVNGVALDGSSIPFYLQVGLGWENMSLEREIQQDMYSGPKIFNVFPDLDEVDKDVFEENYQLFDWVILRDALEENFKQNPARANARIYSNWSYNEGVWAEELFRTMRNTESYVLLAEQINAMAHLHDAKIEKSGEIKKLWKTILKSQHHDISWIEVTDIKRKSIDRLIEAKRKSELIMSDIASLLIEDDNNSIAVFNGLPRQRQGLIELNEGQSLGEYKFQEHEGKSYGFVDLNSGGVKSYPVTDKVTASTEGELPESIKTKFYEVELSPKGLMQQLKSPGAKELLNTKSKYGGEIRARINREWYSNRDADVTYRQGEVFDVVERKTSIKDIPLSETYFYYKHQPFIKVELEFDFSGNEVGYMFLDETKLNVYYPSAGTDVHQDIPFGYKDAKQNRPLFPVSWVECGGLVYVHRGTVKHWVKDGTIANVLAWGDNQFTNRLHWDWIEYTEYDIKLYGKQKIEYYIIPKGEYDGKKITQMVQNIISPTFTVKGKGDKSYYSVEDTDLAVTSLYTKEKKLWVRGYQLPGSTISKFKDWEIFNVLLNELK